MTSTIQLLDQKTGTSDAAEILIIDTRQLLRQCLSHSLTCLPDATVTAVDDIHSYVRSSPDRPAPDVIVYCLADAQPIPGNLSKLIPLKYRGIPVIVISDNCMPSQVFELMKIGVRGFLPTSVTLEVAVQAIRLVLAGGTYVPPSCLRALPQPAKQERQALLTNRQLQVIEALRLGKPNKVIAYELDMCESTVKVHVRTIMKKLKAKNRTEAAYIFSSIFDWEAGQVTMDDEKCVGRQNTS